jgi:hypothetical protein
MAAMRRARLQCWFVASTWPAGTADPELSRTGRRLGALGVGGARRQRSRLTDELGRGRLVCIVRAGTCAHGLPRPRTCGKQVADALALGNSSLGEARRALNVQAVGARRTYLASASDIATSRSSNLSTYASNVRGLGLGLALLAALYLWSGLFEKPFEWSATVAYAASKGLPLPSLMVAGSVLDELVTHSRQASKALTLGFTGGASLQAFAAAAFMAAARIDLVAVPYRGGAQIITDLLGAQIDLAITALPGVLELTRKGDLLSDARSAAAPDVPTGERVRVRKRCHGRNLGRSSWTSQVAAWNCREDQPCGAECLERPSVTRSSHPDR